MKHLFVVFIALFLCGNAFSQSVVGKWKTIDDKTGETKSIVEIYKQGEKVYGKILKTFPKSGDDPDPICTKCPDYRKGKKIIGMQIITGLVQDDDEWEGDDAVLDPESGELYDCKIWLENKNKLAVRGYVAFFYRTQYWQRME